MHHPASMASNQTNPQNYQNLPLPHPAHWTDLNIKLESNEENQNSAKNSIMSSSSSNDSTRFHKIVPIQKYFKNVKKMANYRSTLMKIHKNNKPYFHIFWGKIGILYSHHYNPLLIIKLSQLQTKDFMPKDWKKPSLLVILTAIQPQKVSWKNTNPGYDSFLKRNMKWKIY